MATLTTPSSFKRLFVGDDDSFATQVPADDLVNVAGPYGPIFRVTSTAVADSVTIDGEFRTIAPLANVKAYGAVGDGVTNDTVAIQAAADAIGSAGGGTLYFPSGTFLFSSTVFLDSDTTVAGAGWSSVLKAIAGANWVTNTSGSSPWTLGSIRVLFLNRRWTSTPIADENYIFRDFAADLDTASSVQRKALCSMIAARNTMFSNIKTSGGGAVISHLHTDHSVVRDCFFFDFHSTAADHYSGFVDARVQDNYLRQTAISSSNPAIQFTGTNNDNTSNTSEGVICTGNRVSCGGSHLTSVAGISITASGSGGTVNNAIIAYNDVDMGGLNAGGIICYGGGDNWAIEGNSIRNVLDYNSLLVFANGYGTITRPKVGANRLINCTRTSGNATLLSVISDESAVFLNDLIDCTATTGVAVTGANCTITSGLITGGTITNRVTVTGSNNSVQDHDTANGRSRFSQDVVTTTGFRIGNTGSLLSVYTEAGSWTPTLTFGGAASGMTYSTQTGTYWRIGKMVYARCWIVLTAKGSSTGTAQIAGAPITAGTGPIASFGVSTAANFVVLTDPPVVRISSTTFVLATNVVGGSNLTDANFSNTTNLVFEGWYPTT